jgi:putative membrane protein
MNRSTALLIGLALVVAALAASGIRPYDRFTWLMVVAPVLIAIPVLLATRRRFPLTSLLYALVLVHALVLIVGGAYTYARVPFGFTLAELLGLERNPYDRIGHFFQGFVPALATREILLRGRYVRGNGMAMFLSLCVALAISAVYEMIEWAAALVLGQGSDEFLGTQGDPWDTQSDMFMAGVGALCSLILLAGLHDRQIARLRDASSAG